jgi:hypothetical protein
MEKNLNDHRTSIIGARRRNNIYGEVSDFIVSSILGMGADAAFYNPIDNNVVSVYAKSEHNLYVINIQYQENSKDSIDSIKPGTKTKEALMGIAAATGALPIYAISRSYSRSIKIYDLNDNKLSYLK